MIASNRAAVPAAVALAALALQSAAIHFATSELLVRVALPGTIAFVAAALWPHRRFAGVWVMYVGLGANLAVILANGGLMPIERSTLARAIGEERAAAYTAGAWLDGSKDVLVAPGDGHAVALGDRIIIRRAGDGFAASPGDLVLWAGLAVVAAEASFAWQRGTRRRRAAGERGRTPAIAVGAQQTGAAGSPPTPR